MGNAGGTDGWVAKTCLLQVKLLADDKEKKWSELIDATPQSLLACIDLTAKLCQ